MARKYIYSGNYKQDSFIEDDDGYILIYEPDHPNAYSNGWIPEHRFIMSQHLGRALKPNERVHHKNKFRKDNRIQNLELMDVKDHDALRRKDFTNYFCYLCNSDKTSITIQGYPIWHYEDNKIICHNCYSKIRQKYKKSQKNNIS